MTDTLWCIVIRQHDGTYIRETQNNFPDEDDLRQYERNNKIWIKDDRRPYYDNTVEYEAVVVNVFKVGDN